VSHLVFDGSIGRRAGARLIAGLGRGRSVERVPRPPSGDGVANSSSSSNRSSGSRCGSESSISCVVLSITLYPG